MDKEATHRRYAHLFLIAGLHVLLAFALLGPILMAGGTVGRSPVWLIVWLGIPFSQVGLLAFWAVMGSSRSAVRIPLSLAAGFVLWVVLYVVPSGRSLQRPFLPGIALLAQWLAIVVLLGLAYRWRGWQLGRWAASSADTSREHFQFGIKHLMLWTTLVAVVMGIGRLIVPPIERIGGGDSIGFAMYASCNCLFFLPLFVTALRDRGWWVGVLLAAIWTAIVTSGEILVFSRVFGGRSHLYFVGINSLEATVVVGTLLGLRAAGWRLMKTP